jgi:hypothetical protein
MGNRLVRDKVYPDGKLFGNNYKEGNRVLSEKILKVMTEAANQTIKYYPGDLIWDMTVLAETGDSKFIWAITEAGTNLLVFYPDYMTEKKIECIEAYLRYCTRFFAFDGVNIQELSGKDEAVNLGRQYFMEM